MRRARVMSVSGFSLFFAYAFLENVSNYNGIFITAYKVNHIGIPLAKYETVSVKIPVARVTSPERRRGAVGSSYATA